MVSSFKQYIEQHHLIKAGQRILIAVSGGIDSIALFHLLRLSGYTISIAHCNFQLRGKESDDDESFVKFLASEYDVPFFSNHFNTLQYAEDHQLSIQMAARELRFQWFDELKTQYSFDKIALGHNQNDEVETFFINLFRGTGLTGLHGILATRDHFIRPLLFATRLQIVSFIKENNFVYREDSSNKSDKYLRNRIRNHLLPLINEIHPEGGVKQIHNSIVKVKGSEQIYKQCIEEKKNLVLKKTGDKIVIDLKKLQSLTPIETYLFEFIHPFQFNETQIAQLLNCFKSSGKRFFSPTHQLLVDRNEIIIEPLHEKKNDVIYIDKTEFELLQPIHLTFKIIPFKKELPIPTSSHIAYLDVEKLIFPLILRKWQKGDYFYPFGMNKPKKLSDFFIDNKISVFEKEATWLLCSAENIAWIVGKRLDNRYKINKYTSKAFVVEMKMD